MDGRTDGQGDSYIPPQTLFAGGIQMDIGESQGVFLNPVQG